MVLLTESLEFKNCFTGTAYIKNLGNINFLIRMSVTELKELHDLLKIAVENAGNFETIKQVISFTNILEEWDKGIEKRFRENQGEAQ